MSNKPISGIELLHPLLVNDSSLEKTQQEFKDLFLAFASANEENLKAISNISYGLISDAHSPDIRYYGIKVGPSKFALSDLSHALEDIDLPKEVKSLIPEITQNDWDAATRLLTVILVALERRKAPD